MQRQHRDLVIARREWKKHRRTHVASNINYGPLGRDPWQVTCACDDQVNRFRKSDAGDCGQARCHLCHSDKFPKRELTRQELLADLKLMEGTVEAYDQRD